MTAFHAEIPLKGFMKIMFEKWISEVKHFMCLILLFKPISIHPSPNRVSEHCYPTPTSGKAVLKVWVCWVFPWWLPLPQSCFRADWSFSDHVVVSHQAQMQAVSEWLGPQWILPEQKRLGLSENPALWWMGFSLVLFLRQDFTMWFWLAYVGWANSKSDNCLFCLQTKKCTTIVSENLVSKWPL